MFRMPENTVKNSELETLNISLEDEILEIGVRDDYSDRIAAEYIEKLAHAKNDKNSIFLIRTLQFRFRFI